MKSARYGSYISRNFETPGSPNKVYVGNVVRHSDDLSDDMCVWQRNECCDSWKFYWVHLILHSELSSLHRFCSSKRLRLLQRSCLCSIIWKRNITEIEHLAFSLRRATLRVLRTDTVLFYVYDIKTGISLRLKDVSHSVFFSGGFFADDSSKSRTISVPLLLVEVTLWYSLRKNTAGIQRQEAQMRNTMTKKHQLGNSTFLTSPSLLFQTE